ncbi:branched-chain amino acid transport system II carrier protein [Globicatella sanguinis]|uniref:branched-chain amino acid transport system II carrier protein n=1 Tax=Globicatella sanguinis TaxID=13076 RepID=UPI0025429918|nr:branched-chain amino acid transport system II carrier protein [Globicatella sanguinis]MDK7630299.1 branched-chain amino acid transport system II carrier protein [Globicatella sanguinis]WIK67229.1 branched-chain amino acid transport system II carrier protein [Globicatella sanguinis]WKT56634.1 branched-chain amino acid transport system II carrier protein [Globicatella sanguinis]
MLKRKNFFALSLMSFGIFFGAGNLIFPPSVAQLAGSNIWSAYFGFLITAVILPILGIITVAKTDGLLNLGRKVDPIFAYIITIGILLAIGPGLAIPRTGSTSFEMAIKPWLNSEMSTTMPLILYSAVYFGLVALLCWTPNKIIDRIGRFSTPALLVLILVLTILAFTHQQPTLLEPSNGYEKAAFTTGFLSGYNTLDTLAGLNYGLLIVTAVRNLKVDESKVVKVATKAGIVAGVVLALVYWCLTIIGQYGADKVEVGANGANILVAASTLLLGKFGTLVLGIIFVLACFNTCVGLITSISQFFHRILPQLSYHTYVVILTLWSFALANIGLDGILTYSVPILVLLYPIAITLIILTLTDNWLHHSQLTYRIIAYVVSFISIINSLVSMGIIIPILTALTEALPLADSGLNWMLPVIILMIIAYFTTNRQAVPN